MKGKGGVISRQQQLGIIYRENSISIKESTKSHLESSCTIRKKFYLRRVLKIKDSSSRLEVKPRGADERT